MAENSLTPESPSGASTESSESSEVSKPARPARGRAASTRAIGRCYFSTELAALKLDVSPQALRARIRRHSREEKGEVAPARLGMGVVARKFGPTWRIYFTDAEVADAT